MNSINIKQSLEKNKFTWLITGVAGFIGSNLLESLLKYNQNVIGLDNFSTGYEKNISQAIDDAEKSANKDLSENFKFVNGDIRNIDDCREAVKGVDFVLHHAALGSVPRSIENPIITNDNNINGFLNMLIASSDEKVEKFIYAASSSTYGDHPDLPKKEEIIGKPLSPYAVTKYVNELYAEVFSKIYGLDSIGLRYFNIFGKRQDPQGSYAAVIPKWISSILNNEQVFINGNGDTSRDFCYINNVIEINILAALSKNKESKNQIYNVALNDNINLNELFNLISAKILSRLPTTQIKKPIHKDYREGDVLHSQADISKAKKLLDYDPIYDINKGLEDCMDWFVNDLK